MASYKPVKKLYRNRLQYHLVLTTPCAACGKKIFSGQKQRAGELVTDFHKRMFDLVQRHTSGDCEPPEKRTKLTSTSTTNCESLINEDSLFWLKLRKLPFVKRVVFDKDRVVVVYFYSPCGCGKIKSPRHREYHRYSVCVCACVCVCVSMRIVCVCLYMGSCHSTPHRCHTCLLYTSPSPRD